MARYYAMLARRPEHDHQGTGDSPAARGRDLQEARAEVRYRKRLLDDLEAVQEKLAQSILVQLGER